MTEDADQVREATRERLGVGPTALAMSRFAANSGNVFRWMKSLIGAEDALPVALVGVVVVWSLVWNAQAGLTWTPNFPLYSVLAVPLVFLAIIAIFSTVFSNRVIVEIATYFGLWGIFPIFGVRLNYLAATLNFPLQDKLFARLDAALGFDWRTWASMAWSHPTLIKILIPAYESNLFQPFILVCAFAFWGARGRNRELMTATVVAALITVAISAVLPAFGPYRVYGLSSEWDTILSALRAGTHVPLHYVGIVTFPSFHASLAVIFAAAARSNRYGFAAALLVNGLMLVATVPIGYHYLVDILAGCAIGAGALYFAHLMRRNQEPNSSDTAGQ